MDNGQGIFERIDDAKFNAQLEEQKPMVFKVGEIIEVRGSRLRVDTIYKKKITFKLLPSNSK